MHEYEVRVHIPIISHDLRTDARKLVCTGPDVCICIVRDVIPVGIAESIE